MWVVFLASYMFLLGVFMISLYNVKLNCQNRLQTLNTIYKEDTESSYDAVYNDNTSASDAMNV